MFGKYFVVRKNERRLVHFCYHISHCEGLSRAGHAHESLLLHTALQSADKRIDSFSLVACELIIADKFKMIHTFPHLNRTSVFTYCITYIFYCKVFFAQLFMAYL